MPLMTMLRHSLLAEAVPISGLMFMPSSLSRAETSRAVAPPLRIGTAMPGPLTGAMTANSTKFAPPRQTCSATLRFVAGEIELRST